MFFLLSGEGSTDMGFGKNGSRVCEGKQFLAGPMAIIVDRIVELSCGFSILDVECCGYVSETCLAERAVELKAAKKKPMLPGKKRTKETRFYFNNARILARIAKDEGKKRKDEIVAVLFRDSDCTASSGRGLWDEKRQSMLDGFLEEGFSKGVPMIPKPKSEAWLICVLKENAYRNCQPLEARSGNDNSPNSLKEELKEILGEVVAPKLLCERVRKYLNPDKIDMMSFKAFRFRLEEVL